jgi:hypothetical protein
MNLVDDLVPFSIGNGPVRALASRLLSWLLAPGDRPARIAEVRKLGSGLSSQFVLSRVAYWRPGSRAHGH